MHDDWLDQVTAVIRSSDAVALPLDRLAAELRARFGGEVGVPELRARIGQRADRLLLIEPETPLLGAGLPGADQQELLGILRAAGLAPSPHVMLRGEGEPSTTVEPAPEVTRAVSRSLTQLWGAQTGAEPGRADLVLATRAANTLRGTLRRMSARGPRPATHPGGTRTAGGGAPPAGPAPGAAA